jgi:hypothetical protein
MDWNSIARTERNSLSFRQLVHPGCQNTFSGIVADMGAFCDSAWLAALIALGITSSGISVEGGSVDIRCLADALHEALPAPAGRLRSAVACAAMLLAVSAAPSGCWAQTPAAQTPATQAPAAQTPAATTPDAPVEVPQKIDASLSHSMAKAVTLKIATFSFGTVIYSVGTGSLAAGTALSAINAAASFVILTANDYSWDYFWPNTNVAANSDNFHPLASLSRNTAKYLTLKPMLTVLNVGTVYWWTGSMATTAVTGGAAVLLLPLTFYVNNTLWDWYDWHTVAK